MLWSVNQLTENKKKWSYSGCVLNSQGLNKDRPLYYQMVSFIWKEA